MLLTFTLFDTAVGWCAVAWGGRGVVRVFLPEGLPTVLRDRVGERCAGAAEGAPPPEIQRVVEGIVGLLAGEPRDLSFVALDMDGVPPFHRRVYDVTRRIPAGSVLSYGEVATRLGSPGASRAVGQALGRNPFAIVVPCHRVLAAGGAAGGFSARGGIATKLRILAIEGYAPIERSLFDGPEGRS